MARNRPLWTDGSIDADDIVHQAALVELLLDRCLESEPFPLPPADPAAAVDGLLSVAAGTLSKQDGPARGTRRPRPREGAAREGEG